MSIKTSETIDSKIIIHNNIHEENNNNIKTVFLISSILLSIIICSCGDSNKIISFITQADTTSEYYVKDKIIKKDIINKNLNNSDSVLSMQITYYDKLAYFKTQYSVPFLKHYMFGVTVLKELIKSLHMKKGVKRKYKNKITVKWALYDKNEFLLYEYTDIIVPIKEHTPQRKITYDNRHYEIQRKMEMDKYIFDNIMYAIIDVDMYK